MPARPSSRYPRIVRNAALAIAIAALPGCYARPDQGPVIVSVIGGGAQAVDPALRVPREPARVMLDATAQGLVRFDASGQIEPGLAERWTVLDEGQSYIFRLRDAEWSDGGAVSAREVVLALRRQLGPASKNPLRPFLSAIGEVVEMTPQVIEIRLKRPRPDLLKLLAQPELAIFRGSPAIGSGPFRVVSTRQRVALLRPAFDPQRSGDDDATEPPPEAMVTLRGERASSAILRFARRESHLVAGGTFTDWPLLALADLAPLNIRLDPASGLFGLAVVDRSGFLGEAVNRAAIASAIDRTAIAARFNPEWTTATSILPEQLDSSALPAAPGWAIPQDGAPTLRDRVAAWRQANGGPVVLRIALPQGPGATILFGQIGAALMHAGITPQRVRPGAAADLRLIDAVAPYDSARWYLATACQPCGEEATTAIIAARDAPTLAERSQHIAEADAALTRDVAFIPIARPLRWSLVSLRLKAWTPNPRAWHPLNRLRADPN